MKLTRRAAITGIAVALSAGSAFPLDHAAASAAPVDTGLGYLISDTGSLSAISRITGAQAMWDAGWTGAGVDVAVLDTGVARVPGLDGQGKVIDGPDLSFDSQVPALAHGDGFGHGTHIASIIAGSDPVTATSATCATCLGTSAATDATKFEGIAPDARIVNVKVGAYDGSTDVSQVIAGIDWVVQHAHDRGLNIRVLNISFGVDSKLSASVDPLVYAAERAWAAGIVVVAAAGNEGAATRTIASPAMSRSIIAVGSTDPLGTLPTSDDVVPEFARYARSARGLDLVAPGVSVIGLRVPGSFVDQSVTTGKVGTRFQRGTGTSQSTAVVSGLAALLLSKFPTAAPDQIKAFLKTHASPLPAMAGRANRPSVGAGSADLTTAASTSALPAMVVTPPSGDGTGSLEAARGTWHVQDGGTELRGEQDIFGTPWASARVSNDEARHASWSDGTWNGVRWTGAGWENGRWADTTWAGGNWAGARWSSDTWAGVRWTSAGWTGVRWTGARWSSGTWTGVRWSGARWSDAGWC